MEKDISYPRDTAGSIMTTEYIELENNMTVEQAYEFIKNKKLKKETIYDCYVTKDNKLIGIVNVKDLLISEDTELIKNIMNKEIIKVDILEDQEEVSKKFYKYNLLAVPVVENGNVLVGIITMDDVFDIIHKEVSEDFSKMAAITPNKGDAYLKTSVLKHAKNRIPWLLIMMLSATITGTIIENFESAIATLPLLVSFIPMIMDTGGNCGSQASTLIIRGLATNQITSKDIFKAIWKEIRVAIVVGFVLSIVNSIRIIIQYNDVKIASAVSITLILTIIIAKVLGCTLPIIAKKLKFDPAIMASPLITTIVDTLSVLIFFNISTMIFHI